MSIRKVRWTERAEILASQKYIVGSCWDTDKISYYKKFEICRTKIKFKKLFSPNSRNSQKLRNPWYTLTNPAQIYESYQRWDLSQIVKIDLISNKHDHLHRGRFLSQFVNPGFSAFKWIRARNIIHDNGSPSTTVIHGSKASVALLTWSRYWLPHLHNISIIIIPTCGVPDLKFDSLAHRHHCLSHKCR